MITEKTKLNMVVGNPIMHSKSPLLHASIYEVAGINAALLPFAANDIKNLIAAIRTLSVGLVAVTMPFKQSVMPLLDRIDPTARVIGAVNTIINHKGKLRGYNTDAFGIEYALRGTKLRNKKVLLLGAGGGARAIAYVVKKAGGKLLYANRTPAHAEALRKNFGGQIVDLHKLSAQEIDVIINATPLGMPPRVKTLPLPETLIAWHQTVFDLVYNPLRTKLLFLAEKRGAKIISGLDMFVAQGVRQIELWISKKITSDALISRLKKQIAKTL